jgi:hypothetical protein
MLAGVQGGDDLWGVKGAGRIDCNYVYVVSGDQLAELGRRRLDPVLL